jgi:tetratricopeptide (TPR) repeat protein
VDTPKGEATRSQAWRYPTEQVWLVGETLQALKGLTEYTRTRSQLGDDALAFEIVEAGATREQASFAVKPASGDPFSLVIKDHVFSPAAYRGVASAWLGEVKGSRDAEDRRLPARLGDLRLATLHAASLDVSAALTRDPLSAQAHEDAAFVLAAFALREAAAGHSDPRRILARIAAHLAMARVLRGDAPPSATGRLAEIAAGVRAGRTAEAVARLGEMKASILGEGEEAWRRALLLFATEDWRQASWSDRLTLLERIAWFSAYQARVGSDRAYLFLDALPPSDRGLPDWGRIRLSGWPSVRDCHSFAVGGVAYDLQEATEAAQLFKGAQLDHAALIAALNEESPASPVYGPPDVRVEVLDWGLVAAFVQRHIGARLSYEASCYERTFGQPEELPAVLAGQEQSFGRLSLYPLDAERWTKTAAAQKHHAAAALRLIQEKPHLVTAHVWSILNDVPGFADPVGIPPATRWFRPLMPFGTVFPGSGRLHASRPRHVTVDLYRTLILLDPYDTDLPWGLASLERGGKWPTYDDLREGFGPALAWDVLAIRSLASRAKDEPAARRALLTKACELDVDSCGALGKVLVSLKDEATAAEVYRRWWREGIDRVGVANDIAWLVEYERKSGRSRQAFEIAKDAASTYSHAGLVTLARLSEATGRLDEAEDNFRKAAERYDTPVDLYYFYERQLAAGRRRYEGARAEIEKALFPNGFEKVEALPTEKPMDGVIMSGLEEDAVKAGFRHGDVIVALDGIRVRSRPQWVFVRDRTTDPSMTVVVYRGSFFQEIRCRFEKRIIPAQIQTYPQTR